MYKSFAGQGSATVEQSHFAFSVQKCISCLPFNLISFLSLAYGLQLFYDFTGVRYGVYLSSVNKLEQSLAVFSLHDPVMFLLDSALSHSAYLQRFYLSLRDKCTHRDFPLVRDMIPHTDCPSF